MAILIRRTLKHACTRGRRHAPAARAHDAAGVEIIAENQNLFGEKAARLV